jgi:hypothetical protein
MTDLNEKLAQEAAELINGGEWRDGKWYSDGQRDAWRRALQPAADRIEKLEAALREIVDVRYFGLEGTDMEPQEMRQIARKALGETP